MSLAFLAKKSWHTATLKNTEQVWLAEEKVRKEKNRIFEMQQKLKEEMQAEEAHRLQVEAGLAKPKKPKLDWMYEGPIIHKANPDDYLLGKALEDEGETDVIKELATNASAGSLLLNKPATSGNEMFTRLHEDPMFLIRQKRLAARQRVTQNPIRMSRIREAVLEMKSKKALKKQKKKDKKRAKKAAKKARKRARGDKRASGGQRDDDSSDDGGGRARGRSRSRSRSHERLPPRRGHSDERGRARESAGGERRRSSDSRGRSSDGRGRSRGSAHRSRERSSERRREQSRDHSPSSRRRSSQPASQQQQPEREGERRAPIAAASASGQAAAAARPALAQSLIEKHGSKYGLQLPGGLRPGKSSGRLGPSAQMLEERKGFLKEQQAARDAKMRRCGPLSAEEKARRVAAMAKDGAIHDALQRRRTAAEMRAEAAEGNQEGQANKRPDFITAHHKSMYMGDGGGDGGSGGPNLEDRVKRARYTQQDRVGSASFTRK